MRTERALILAAAFLVLVPALSPAEVRITLKNGRSFFANDCWQVNGKYRCELEGGTIEIDKQEIKSTKEVNIPKRPVFDTQPEASNEPEPGKKVSDGEKASQEKTPATDSGEKVVRGLDPEQAKQLDRIDKEKTAMMAERDSLAKDRDQLYEDVKNAGVMRNQEQIDGIKKRIADLDRRINGFNEALKKLNSEEEMILKR